jgi:hypothetical protein
LNREERMELKIPWKEVRVMQRVAQGGHDGPSGPRARRYLQSLKNLAGTLKFVSDAREIDNASNKQPFRPSDEPKEVGSRSARSRSPNGSRRPPAFRNTCEERMADSETGEEVVETLDHGWVRQRGIAERRAGQPCRHGQMDGAEHFAGLDRKDAAAEDAVRLRVDHGFEEAARFAHRLCPRNRGDRQFRHPDLAALFPCFGFRESNARQFGLREQSEGHQPVARAPLSAIEDIRLHDAVIVERGVRELRPAIDVAQRPDAGRGGFEP